MIVTTLSSNHILSLKRLLNSYILRLLLGIIWLAGLLPVPAAASNTSINIQEVTATDSGFSESTAVKNEEIDQTATNVHSPNTANTEPDILKVYNALFKQTWEQSPDIQVARKLKEQKTAEKYTSLAKRFAPQLDFEIAQKRFLDKDSASDDTEQTTPEAETPYTDGTDVTDWNFDLDIPLYRRPLSLDIDVSKLEYELASNNLDINTRELDSRLHELLGNYMVARYKLHNLTNSILISQEHVSKIQRGYNLRDQTKLALLRAQANLKELEARQDLNEQRRDTTFRELLDFTAIPEDNPSWHWLNELLDAEKRTAGCINSFSALDASIDKMQPFLTDSATDEELRSFFADNSLLYKKILIERNLGKTKAKKYTQQEWPALFVRGELDRKEDTHFNEYSGEGSIGLILSVPLFSGGTLFSNIKTRDMATEITSIQEYSTILRTFNSIANKKKTITSLRDIFTKQQIHLLQQQEIVQLSLKSYQIKQTSMQDLLTSKNRLIDAKNLLMRTTADLGILLRQFAWELGTPFPAPTTPQ